MQFLYLSTEGPLRKGIRASDVHFILTSYYIHNTWAILYITPFFISCIFLFNKKYPTIIGYKNMTSKLKHFISSSQGKNGFGWHYDDGLQQHTSEWSKEILNIFSLYKNWSEKGLFVSRSVSCYCKQPSLTKFNGYTRICLHSILFL